MDLREVRTFVAVADLGTVSKAAEHLHITQPALSRRIADLEGELGLKLFDRVGRRLLLTSEGAQLLKECRGLLSYSRAVREQAEGLKRGDAGMLRVSASPHLIEGLFPNFLRDYAKRYPNVQVRLVEAVGPQSFEMLEKGEIHLAQAVVRGLTPDDRRFGSYPLAPMEMLAACRPSLKLGKNGSIEIQALSLYPLLQATDDFAMRRSFDSACRLAGFVPNYVLECRSPHALLSMAQAGHGVAIVPSALRIHGYVLRLLRILYRGKPLNEPLTIVYDKRRPLPSYAKVFCDMLADHAKEVFPVRCCGTAR
ncbi:MAG TPA: LysR family transcriptional regulator [Burkholderiales bacterium]|jgi:DNA-binding transcriptional LysR family regulator